MPVELLEEIKMNENQVNTGIEETVETTTEQVEAKTYTDEQLALLLQKEGDRRVSEALKKQEKKFKKELSLSRLDDDERAKAEKDAEIAELREQLAAFQIEKNRSELKSVLSSRGLSAEFADIISINDDIEESQSNIEKLDKLFKAAVRAEVEKRLAGNVPKGNAARNPAELTKDDIKGMSLAELQAFKKANPEAYNNYYNR
jgi:hypothetical protein